MGNDFFAYVQHLEMLAFFSGYPLVYYFVRFLFRNASSKNGWRAEIVSILPFAYALIGTLYLGLMLKNLYPDYTIENLQYRIQQPYLNIWAILSNLFWIPTISRKQVLSVLHSLHYDQPLTAFATDNPHPNFAFGFEFITSGRTFQLFVGNYTLLNPQQNSLYNSSNPFGYTDNGKKGPGGQFNIGFNIMRLWNF